MYCSGKAVVFQPPLTFGGVHSGLVGVTPVGFGVYSVAYTPPFVG